MAGDRLTPDNSDDPAHPFGWPLFLRSCFSRHRQAYGNKNAFRHVTMADAGLMAYFTGFFALFLPKLLRSRKRLAQPALIVCFQRLHRERVGRNVPGHPRTL
jgi:hypothetical protein